MEILRRLLPLFAILALPAHGDELPYRVIAYHDVRDQVAGDYDPDQFAVSTANLIDQFTWLRDNGFHVVSLDQVVAARDGVEPLPENSVLLTFDDGLESVYTHVFPLLRMFDYPAVVNIVTSWIESGQVVDYAGRKRGSDGFLSWEQMREMQASGLVEFASHSHDLHQGIPANPQGNLQPAAKTLAYDGENYESEADFRRRLNADLARSVAAIEEHLGRPPRAIAWPYGAYNGISASVAADLGMPVILTLNTTSTAGIETLSLGRYLVTANPFLGDFSAEFLVEKPAPIVRVAQVDLDDVYDPDARRQRRNLDRLLDRIKALEISHVFLQAFADGDADGIADAVYFPNRHLPVQAELFSYVSWQLKTRANVLVFSRLPLLGFSGAAFDPAWRIVDGGDDLAPQPESKSLLSPFNPLARERIGEVYEDLAASSHLDGIVIYDDGRLTELADFSDAAIAWKEAHADIVPDGPADAAAARLRSQELTSRALVEFSRELLQRVQRYEPAAKSARTMPADALVSGNGAAGLAADFDVFLGAYDFVALRATLSPRPGSANRRFLEEVVDNVRLRENGLARTIFELKTGDRDSIGPLADELRSTMRWLQSIGVTNIGYYPADFIGERPDIREIRLGMSLANDLAGSRR